MPRPRRTPALRLRSVAGAAPNYTQEEAKQILERNTAEDNAVQMKLAERLVQQQEAALPSPAAIRATVPEEGRRITFTRALLVELGGEHAAFGLDVVAERPPDRLVTHQHEVPRLGKAHARRRVRRGEHAPQHVGWDFRAGELGTGVPAPVNYFVQVHSCDRASLESTNFTLERWR